MKQPNNPMRITVITTIGRFSSFYLLTKKKTLKLVAKKSNKTKPMSSIKIRKNKLR